VQRKFQSFNHKTKIGKINEFQNSKVLCSKFFLRIIIILKINFVSFSFLRCNSKIQIVPIEKPHQIQFNESVRLPFCEALVLENPSKSIPPPPLKKNVHNNYNIDTSYSTLEFWGKIKKKFRRLIRREIAIGTDNQSFRLESSEREKRPEHAVALSTDDPSSRAARFSFDRENRLAALRRGPSRDARVRGSVQSRGDRGTLISDFALRQTTVCARRRKRRGCTRSVAYFRWCA